MLAHEEIFASLEARIKAVEDSDANMNQEAAKAIIDLQNRLKKLEKDYRELQMNHENLFHDYLHYKVNHP